MADAPTSKPPADPFAEVQRQYLPVVLDEIRRDAEKRASDQGHGDVTYIDAFRAFEQRFGQIPSVERLSFWEAVFGKDNSFVIIMAVMTITFGLLGLAPMLFSIDTKGAYNNAAFLDIAKLFAGVIVGGAAGAAAGRRAKT